MYKGKCFGGRFRKRKSKPGISRVYNADNKAKTDTTEETGEYTDEQGRDPVANTEFFVEAVKDHSSITWKDIFSESFVKHTKADMEFAMQNGTLARQVPESHMLETWNRPWLWWPLAKWGLGLIAVLYILFFFQIGGLGLYTYAFYHLVMIIPPRVIPLIIMILLWEMNIPQNISLTDLLMFFMGAGVINFLVTGILFLPFPGEHASYAALREEPAKLVAALMVFWYIQHVQKKKIYGLTGIVVGAAVGAAFSALESVSYAIDASEVAGAMIFVQVLRSALALGGHFAYCIPYATAIALNAENGKVTLKSVFHPMTLLALALSIGCHALWNAGYGLTVNIALLAASVFIILYWIKKSLQQIVQICGPKRSSGPAVYAQQPAGRNLSVYCNNTALQGTTWEVRTDTMLIGRQREMCGLCFDGNTPGVSRQHCKIFKAQGSWYIQDLNSTYGTYVCGKKLAAFAACPLNPGDDIYLGSRQVWLTVR